MREAGGSDATTRGYNLLYYGVTPSAVSSALIALDFRGSRPYMALGNLQRQLETELGTLLDCQTIKTYLVEWWHWYRINHGYIRSWPTTDKVKKEAPALGLGASG